MNARSESAGDAGGNDERARCRGRGDVLLEPMRLIIDQWGAALMAANIVMRGASVGVTNICGLVRLSVDENVRAAGAVVRASANDVLPLQVEVARASVRRGLCRSMLIMRMVVEIADEACYPIVRQWSSVSDRLDRVLSH